MRKAGAGRALAPRMRGMRGRPATRGVPAPGRRRERPRARPPQLQAGVAVAEAWGMRPHPAGRISGRRGPVRRMARVLRRACRGLAGGEAGTGPGNGGPAGSPARPGSPPGRRDCAGGYRRWLAVPAAREAGPPGPARRPPMETPAANGSRGMAIDGAERLADRAPPWRRAVAGRPGGPEPLPGPARRGGRAALPRPACGTVAQPPPVARA